MIARTNEREGSSMDGANKPLLVERAASWLLLKIRENAVPLAASLIAGFLAYAFFFTNPYHGSIRKFGNCLVVKLS